MTRRKLTSKRRWKARAAIGRAIPLVAIMQFELDKWFKFEGADDYCFLYRVAKSA